MGHIGKAKRDSDRTGSGGHLGCSEGFNFNLYKEHLPEKTNSQGREQLHSKLDKMVESLIQMQGTQFSEYCFGLMLTSQTNDRKEVLF